MFHPFVITVITVIVIARWGLTVHLFLLSEAIGEAARHLRELVGSPSAETRRRWDSPFSSRVGFMVSCFIKVVQTCAGWAYGKQNRWNGGFFEVDGANMSIWVEQIVRFMERLLQWNIILPLWTICCWQEWSFSVSLQSKTNETNIRGMDILHRCKEPCRQTPLRRGFGKTG